MHTPTLQASRKTKTTRVGEIPVDWIVRSLDDCFSLASGDTKPTDTQSQPDLHCQVPVYGGNGVLGFTSSANSNSPEIIIGRVGENCGAVHYVEGPHWITDNALFTETWTEEYDLRFFYYLLQHLNLGRLRNKGGQPLISQKPIYAMKIGLPPLAEQKSIAAFLTTWDRALEQQERLLTAKRKRKQGLMQQLLTGKRRFKEFVKSGKMLRTHFGLFPAEWPVVCAGDIADEVTEKNGRSAELPVLTCSKHRGLVNSLEYFGKRIYSEDTRTYKVVRRGDFAYATNHIEEGSIGYQNLHHAALISPMYTVFRTRLGVDHSFLFKLLKTELYRHIFEANTNGSINRRGALRWDDFARIKIHLPGEPEQRRIAAVLSTCDQEIELLQRQLDALKEQKRGLMQKLLTGEIRVKG